MKRKDTSASTIQHIQEIKDATQHKAMNKYIIQRIMNYARYANEKCFHQETYRYVQYTENYFHTSLIIFNYRIFRNFPGRVSFS